MPFGKSRADLWPDPQADRIASDRLGRKFKRMPYSLYSIETFPVLPETCGTGSRRLQGSLPGRCKQSGSARPDLKESRVRSARISPQAIAEQEYVEKVGECEPTFETTSAPKLLLAFSIPALEKSARRTDPSSRGRSCSRSRSDS